MKTSSSFIEKVLTNPKYFNLLGFTIIRNVLEQDDIMRRRNVSKKIFDQNSPNQRILFPTQIVDVSDLHLAILNPKIMNALQAAFYKRMFPRSKARWLFAV